MYLYKQVASSNGLFWSCCFFFSPPTLALDPAYPGFDGPNSRRRLEKSDALFVDVIHSNARGVRLNAVGLETPLGHADFYVCTYITVVNNV